MEQIVFRYRVQYAKTAVLRYTGHLDVHRVWERTFRRARLQIAYSQGFHPQPRLQQACALPLGFTSQAELIDLWLLEGLEPDQLRERLVAALPPGLTIHTVDTVDLRAPALQTRVRAVEYLARPLDPQPASFMIEQANTLMAQPSLPRTWRDKPYDLRPLILELEVLVESEGQPIRMLLSAREGATGRPEEVLSALGLDPQTSRVERTRIVMETPGL